MIVETLKENNIKQVEFRKYANMTHTEFNYALRKKNPIFLNGLKLKLRDFLKWKANQLNSLAKQITKSS